MALFFALMCCLCAALNDLVFRLYAAKVRSRGIYIVIIGVIWTLIFVLFAGMGAVFSPETLFWGTVSGVFSVTANILLLEGMSDNDVGICATIYRLNLVFAACGAFMLLNEDIGIAQISGIIFATMAVLLFFPNSGQNAAAKGKIGFFLVGFAALLRAGMGLSYKYAFVHDVDRNGLLIINGLLWIVGGGIYLIGKEKHLIRNINLNCCRYGIISGLLVVGIVFFMALALQHGDAIVVIPLTQMSFLVTCVLGAWVLHEKMDFRKNMGIVAGILCIICMSLT